MPERPVALQDQDRLYMRHALALARRSLGATWPNPAAGCVVVKDGRIVGRGHTAAGGRPHAETVALDAAGTAAAGATAYVSLEPCSHQGETGPCSTALIDAGVARVVVALRDPDPRVDGGGLAALRAAGIEVTTDVLHDEAASIAAGFVSRIRRGRPLVALKMATSLDGRIALASGESQWITGPQIRAAGHDARARYDAVLVGSQTVLDDDPMLTCRLGGGAVRQPVRIIVDGRLRTPATAKMIETASEVPTWIVTRDGADAGHLPSPVAVIAVPDPHDVLDVLGVLAHRGLTSVLVEGGGTIAAGFLAAGAVDRLYHHTGPVMIGSTGRPATGPLNLARLGDAPRFVRGGQSSFGPDMLASYTYSE